MLMSQIVLFLIAVVLVIVIWRLIGQHKKTVFRISLILLSVVVLLIGSVAGWLQYSAWKDNQQYKKDVVSYFSSYDEWARKSKKENGDNYYTLDVMERYAEDLANARGHSYWYTQRPLATGVDGLPVFYDMTIMTLAEPLDGVTEIKVRYNRGLSSGVVESAIEGGYRGGILVTILTLDMTKRWNPNKRAWVPTKD
ncbi:hypothetical protein DR73_1837 [Enterobacteriaceae bacterium ATCC 29904]|nr:hypothetical protein DR73_1837 [Enterobacteriaceae bacterium ATCC 29904]